MIAVLAALTMTTFIRPVAAADDPPEPADAALESNGPAVFVQEEVTFRNGAVSGVVPFEPERHCFCQ
jgi:hypothetical protein